MRALHAFAFCLTLLFVTQATPRVWAQTDASMNELLDQVGLDDETADRSPVPASEVNEVNLKVHWRLWKRVHADGKPGSDELAALAHDAHSVGWLNQPQYAMAVAALATGQSDGEAARAMFESAQYLAPNLPYPYLLESAWLFRNDIGDAGGWIRGVVMGIKAGVKWPDTAFPWALKFLVYALLAWGAAFAMFVLGQLLRNFGVAAYDFARVLPRGFSSNQTSLLLVALVAIPGLVAKSALLSIAIVLAAASIVQRRNERVVTILAFGLIAALPYADRALGAMGDYPGSLTQTIAQAQYVSCGAACRETLAAHVAEDPEDLTLRYADLLAAYRAGGKANLSRIDEEVASTDWPGELIGYAHNMRGAALVALARPEAAIPVLEQAREELGMSVAPSFNLMRAHQMLDDTDAAARHLDAATARDIRAVTEQLRYERRDVNSFLIVEPLPLSMLWPHRFQTADPDHSPLARVWRLIAGKKLELHEHAVGLGLAGMLIALLGFPLRRRTSTPCPRCGLARDPVDATEKTANHAYCYPCYSTFVAGAQLDYDARVHNEKVLGRRETFQRVSRRLLSLLLPGLGHVVSGWAGTGFAMTFAGVFGLAWLLAPLGVVRPAEELVTINWAGQVTIAAIIVGVVVLMALNAALRDIPPVALEKGER